jgi:hypothetical protein
MSIFPRGAFLTDGPRLDPKTMPVLMDYGLPVLTSQAADVVANYVRKGGTS